MTVDLPLPILPTSSTRSPRSTERLTSLMTGSEAAALRSSPAAFGYLNDTRASRSTSPAAASAPAGGTTCRAFSTGSKSFMLSLIVPMRKITSLIW